MIYVILFGLACAAFGYFGNEKNANLTDIPQIFISLGIFVAIIFILFKIVVEKIAC